MTLIPAPDGTIADTIATITRAIDNDQPLTFAEHHGNHDIYTRGDTMFVLPGIWTGMPPDLLATMRARRTCNVTGQCPHCDACLHLATGTVEHEQGCTIADNHLRPALTRWGRQVGPARGQRIREIPEARPTGGD